MGTDIKALIFYGEHFIHEKKGEYQIGNVLIIFIQGVNDRNFNLCNLVEEIAHPNNKT